MKSILLKSAFLIMLSLFAVDLFAAKDGKDVIIVLDTSQSMIGKGGENVMPIVKQSLYNEIDKFNIGDTLTFMTFDSDVKTYATMDITDENSKDIVKKWVTGVEAGGWWTFTDNMIRIVAEKSKEMKQAKPDRLQIVLILTDALDDPPPAEKGKKAAIADFAQLQSDYVYIFDLSKKGKNALEEKLAGNTEGNVEVVNASTDTSTVLDGLGDKIDSAEKEYQRKNRPFFLNPFFIAALVSAIVLGIIFFLIRAAGVRVAGVIKYRNLDKVRVEWEETDLSRFMRKRVAIGKSPSLEHYLRDYDGAKPVVLEAVKFQGNVRIVVNENAGTQVEYKGDKKESFLKDGDTFSASNYEFIYLEQLKDK